MNPRLESLRSQWQQWRGQFEALAPREQRMLIAAAVVVFLAVLYLGVWEPAAAARARNAQELADARALAIRLEALAPAAEAAHSHAAHQSTHVSLLAAVDQATRDGMLPKSPTRLQPDGDKRARLWFDDIPFNPVLQWLQHLQNQQGIVVESAEFERKPKAGLTDVRLALVRGK